MIISPPASTFIGAAGGWKSSCRSCAGSGRANRCRMKSAPIGPQSPRPRRPELLIGGYVPAIVQRIAKWGDGYMAPGGGEPESMLKMWHQILQAWRDARAAGKPRWVGASYFALGPQALDHATRYINQTMDTIRSSRRNDCAPCRLRETAVEESSSAKTTWAWTNSYCVRARRI